MKVSIIITASFLALSSAAQSRAPSILPPLLRGAAVPHLALQGLAPTPRHAVSEALADARRAVRIGRDAEAVWRKAMAAAGAARAAAVKTLPRPVRFDGKPCRYRGGVQGGMADGAGVLVCGKTKYEGQFHQGRPDGLVVETGGITVFAGQYRDGRREGLGADYKIRGSDAYEGGYSNGDRIGFGIERDPDGVYPGRYGFYTDPVGKPHNIELSGTQDFRGSHWAGTYGFYTGPKIACSLIKGAVLEGSVLNGPGAKFDAHGRMTEQARYRVGTGGSGPPC